MEINLNTRGLSLGTLSGAVQGNGVDKAESGFGRGFDNVTVTSAPASAEDIAAAGISDRDLRRDDDIGRLVMKAFAFEPPPMPKFE